MAKSIKVNHEKRGRPATGRDPVSAVRLSGELTAAVDRWGDSLEVTRSEAIRRLVELGLSKSAPSNRLQASRSAASAGQKATKSSGSRVRARAKELAAAQIEKMIDPTATPDERIQRRRRLTKGPSEFREDRVDLVKPKS